MSGGQRYVFLRLLGKGGMGEVWLADDTLLKRQVAIKRIHAHLLVDKEFLERLSREAVLHARVGNHPNIVSIYDRVDTDDQILVVMEFVPGLTLRSMLDDPSMRLGVADSVRVGIQILGALEAIHAHGIIHRDLKPENIIVERKPQGLVARLLDFGIARGGGENTLTMPMAGSPGTPIYMAPELIVPDEYGGYTPSIDLYAMGIMLYECLTGKAPFSGGFNEVLAAHLHQKAKPIVGHSGEAVSPALSAQIFKALQKQPADRHASAGVFRENLTAVLEGRPVAGDGMSSPPSDAAIPGVFSQPGPGATVMRPGRVVVPPTNATMLAPGARPKPGTKTKSSTKRGTGKTKASTQRPAIVRMAPKLAIGAVVIAAGVFGYLWWSDSAKAAGTKSLAAASAGAVAAPELSIPSAHSVTARCYEALRAAAPHLHGFAPNVAIRVEEPKTLRNDGRNAVLEAQLAFESNLREAIPMLAYLRHQKQLTDPQFEALQWLENPERLRFEFHYELRDGSWAETEFRAPIAVSGTRPGANRGEYSKMLFETDARELERGMDLETLVSLRANLADKALKTYIDGLAALDMELAATRERATRFREAAKAAEANVGAMKAERDELLRKDELNNADKVRVASLSDAIPRQREMAQVNVRSAKLEDVRLAPLERRRHLVYSACASYAIGKKMTRLAGELVATIRKYPAPDENTRELFAIVLERYAATMEKTP